MNIYICYVCRKKFRRYSSTVRNPKTVCCSKACRDISYIDKFNGKNNPNFKNGKWIKESFCLCGNPKDSRAIKCSFCARKGFAKKGARTILELDKDSLQDMVTNNLSLHAVYKIAGISKYSIKKLINKYKIDTSHFVQSGKAKRYLYPEIVLIKNSKFGNTATRNLISRLGILENKCYKCGIRDWQGEKITLILHHENGHRNDNRIKNLTILCPNCHSQTDTYTGRNKHRY